MSQVFWIMDLPKYSKAGPYREEGKDAQTNASTFPVLATGSFTFLSLGCWHLLTQSALCCTHEPRGIQKHVWRARDNLQYYTTAGNKHRDTQLDCSPAVLNPFLTCTWKDRGQQEMWKPLPWWRVDLLNMHVSRSTDVLWIHVAWALRTDKAAENTLKLNLLVFSKNPSWCSAIAVLK